MLDLDFLITSKFKLFQGLRPEEIDREIYDKVMQHCISEISLFLEENLDKRQLNTLDRLADDNQALQKQLRSYIKMISNGQLQLYKQLDTYLNILLYQTLNRVNSK